MAADDGLCEDGASKSVAGGKQNATVYGICSDRMRYLFVTVDNNGLVSCKKLVCRRQEC